MGACSSSEPRERGVCRPVVKAKSSVNGSSGVNTDANNSGGDLCHFCDFDGELEWKSGKRPCLPDYVVSPSKIDHMDNVDSTTLSTESSHDKEEAK